MDTKKESPERLEPMRGNKGSFDEHKDTKNSVDNQTFSVKFSYFTGGITSTKPRDNTMTVERLAKGIREHFQEETNKIRQYLADGETDKADEIKRGLPYATPSGIFSKRSANNLLTYSGVMVLDIDDLDDVNNAKQNILSQKEVDIIMLFVSPSGKGIKVFVPATTAEEHVLVFRMYQRYFDEELDLQVDESGKDICRACFVCHDSDVYYSDKYEFRKLNKYWTEPQQQVNDLQRAGGAGGATNDADEVAKVYKIVSEIKSKGVDIAPTYDDYLKVGFSLATLGETGRQAYHDVCSQSTKYNYKDADAKFSECLKNGRGDITLATFFELAKKAGVDITKNNDRKRTHAKKDNTLDAEIKDGEDFLWYAFKDNDEAHGEIVSTPARIAKFLEKENFMRISEPCDDRVVIIRSEVKTLKPFNHEVDTIDYLSRCIKHNDREMDIKNWLAKNMKNANTVWKLLKGTPYDLQKDTKDAVYLYFANGVAKVTRDGVTMIDYSDPSIKFYPEVETMKHTFVNTLADVSSFESRRMGDFERFLNYAALGTDKDTSEYTKDDLDKMKCFYSMIGYLISNYKDMANSRAIILSDDGADDESRRGGRGKSLLTRGLMQIRSNLWKGGEDFQRSYRHIFANLEKMHDVYVVDDLPPGFNFDNLYPDISGDISVERKGKPAITIPFEHAPKFILSTNWAVRFEADAVSTNRRFGEYKFTDFWGDYRKPDIYFGRLFFSEWNYEQWQLFFEFMAFCVIVFLNVGLQIPKYSKIDDNFNVYFANPLEEDRFRLVWERFKDRRSYTISEFTDEYVNVCGRQRGKFYEKNIRKPIEAYIAKYNLPWKYVKNPRRMFVRIDDENEGENENKTDRLPF